MSNGSTGSTADPNVAREAAKQFRTVYQRIHDEVGHMMEGGHCVATIHAEANAIIQAAKNGVMINGASIYTTASPCWNCFKLIANSGIVCVYYGEFYRDTRSIEVAKNAGSLIEPW